ncbi:hypothetical protein ACFCYH_08130 [Streptomyces sp. NPDC056400]|uniref:hypothetical protein n=1 Tax=Streptomyces sp. NPDC056400 TaxID=3345808 RepID=UPI0035DFE3BA
METGSLNTTIPFKVVPATESHDVSFRQVHTADGGRIRNRKICGLDGRQLLPVRTRVFDATRRV